MSTYGLSLIAPTLSATAALAADADAAGFDAVWASEFYVRSATVSMAAMAQATRACRIGSSIMYGVGRSPLVLATEARDLAELSDGRIVLGIGNGTKRMMSDWHSVADTDAPALRIEELVPLVRRIWNLHDGPVQHRGRFYNMNLIPSGPVDPPTRAIPIITAAVRPRMCEAAGRVADGLAGHPLFTTGYVEEIVRPAVAKGAACADRNPPTSRSSRWSCAPSTTTPSSRAVKSPSRSPSTPRSRPTSLFLTSAASPHRAGRFEKPSRAAIFPQCSTR